MARRHEVRLLREKGKRTQKEVALVTGVPERSIRRIEREGPVATFDDRVERAERGIGRPSKVAEWAPRIEEILAQEPELLTVEILRRVKSDGFVGAKSALYEAVARLRPRGTSPIARFEGLPGEFSQHDFGEVDVKFLDGRVARVQFFASRLKWSRWTEVTITEDQRVESLVRSLVGHFDAFGGVPLVSVFDRPKTIALKWEKDGRVTEWNATFLQVMGEVSVAPEVCWPYQPRQKGAVENLVGWVKGSFFKCRRFVDKSDLYLQLEAWLDEVNNRRPSRATNEAPAQRMASAERARLRPLKVSPALLSLRYPVQVGPDAMVSFDGYRYSMPPNAAGQSATLYLRADSVLITAGRWSATHPRLRGDQRESHLPDHRVAMVGAVRGPRAKLYLKRQHIQDLGQEAVLFLTELVHRRPQQWPPEVERIYEMLLLHGDSAVLAAIRAANATSTWGAEYVAHHLGESDRIYRLVVDGEGVAQ